MSYNVSFQEIAKIQKEILSNQQLISLEKAKKQVQSLQQSSSQKIKKRSS